MWTKEIVTMPVFFFIERLSVPVTDYSAVVLASFSMNFMLSTHTLTYEAGSFWIVFLLGFVK